MALRWPDLINLANAISDRGRGLREANAKESPPKKSPRSVHLTPRSLIGALGETTGKSLKFE